MLLLSNTNRLFHATLQFVNATLLKRSKSRHNAHTKQLQRHYERQKRLQEQQQRQQCQLKDQQQSFAIFKRMNLKHYDCIIEVHDARIPVTGRNPSVQEILTVGGHIPYMLILNKEDLISENKHKEIRLYLQMAEGIRNVYFTSCKQPRQKLRRIMEPITELIEANKQKNRKTEDGSIGKDDPNDDNGIAGYRVLVVGTPRAGKCALLQQLNYNNVYKDMKSPPAEIIKLMENQQLILNEKPLIYTPRFPITLPAYAANELDNMKLNIMGYRQCRRTVSQQLQCEFLLTKLNAAGLYQYVQAMEVERPESNVRNLLRIYCEKKRLYVREELRDGGVAHMPDYELAAEHMLKLFRQGGLGKLCLD